MTFSSRVISNTTMVCGGTVLAVDAVSLGLFHHGPFDIILDLVCGGLMGSSVFFFAPQKKLTWDEYQASKMRAVEGMNMTEAAGDIRAVVGETTKIRQAIKNIRNPNITRQLVAITEVCDQLAENFRNDPRDISTAKLWIDQYLPKFREQVVRYQELSIKGTDSSDAQEVLVKFEKMLPDVLASYKGILEDCLRNDITDLSVGSAVYKRLIDGGTI